MKISPMYLAAAVATAAAIALPSPTFAQDICVDTPCYDGGGIEEGVTTAETIIGVSSQNPRQTILDILFIVLSYMALIAVVVIVIAGIFLVVSGGDDAIKDKARKMIFYTIIGLLVILFAAAIVGLVTNIVTDAVT